MFAQFPTTAQPMQPYDAMQYGAASAQPIFNKMLPVTSMHQQNNRMRHISLIRHVFREMLNAVAQNESHSAASHSGEEPGFQKKTREMKWIISCNPTVCSHTSQDAEGSHQRSCSGWIQLNGTRLWVVGGDSFSPKAFKCIHGRVSQPVSESAPHTTTEGQLVDGVSLTSG